MIYFLPILAITGIVGLLCYARNKKECKGLCVSCAVTCIALLVTGAMALMVLVHLEAVLCLQRQYLLFTNY